MADIITIYDEETKYACFPWACRTETRVWVAFRIGTQHAAEHNGGIYVVYSDDEGYSWSRPECIINRPWSDERAPGLHTIGDTGMVVLSGMSHYKSPPYDSFVFQYESGQKEWREIRFICHSAGFRVRFPFWWGGLWFGGNFGTNRALIHMYRQPCGWGQTICSLDALPMGDEWIVSPMSSNRLYCIERRDESRFGGEYLASFALVRDNDKFYYESLNTELFCVGDPASRPSLEQYEEGKFLSAFDNRTERRIYLARGEREAGDVSWEEPEIVLSGDPYLADWDYGYPWPVMLKDGRVLVVFYGYVEGRLEDRAIYGVIVDETT